MKFSKLSAIILLAISSPIIFAQESTTQTTTLQVPQLHTEVKEQTITKTNFHIVLDLNQFYHLNFKAIEKENAGQWLQKIASETSDRLKAKQFQVTIFDPAKKLKVEERLDQVNRINSNIILQLVPKNSYKSPISVTQIYFPSNLFDSNYASSSATENEEQNRIVQTESELFLDAKIQTSLLAGIFHKNFQQSETIKTGTPLPIPLYSTRRTNKPAILIEIGYQEIDYKLGFNENYAVEFAEFISKSIVEYHNKTN